VITDIRMPKMNGIDLLKGIRAHDSATAVIILTGYPSVDNIRDVDRLGVEGFFTKPLDVDRFMDTLHRIQESQSISR